jgi:4-hydroxy-3-methylbut-2-enyl diphosphate reductase
MSGKEKKIYLAEPRGVCAGVIRAIKIVDDLLKSLGPPIYVKHQIVHNRFVIDDFKSRGVVFIENLDEIPVGSTLIFSAHGVAPEVLKQAQRLGLMCIDATCPIVNKIHAKAVKLQDQGYEIILIGHKEHPEIIGTLGHLNGKAIIVENESDALSCVISESNKKLTYLTQTTLSPDDVSKIIKILKSRFSYLRVPERDDICYATLERQHAVKSLARKVEIVLVLGSEESSNSNRLREIAEMSGTKSILINSYKEIKTSDLNGINIVGISAGASAPDILVEDTVKFLETKGFVVNDWRR